MTNAGFQVDVYLKHIKQLMFNYTRTDLCDVPRQISEPLMGAAVNSLARVELKRNYRVIQTYEWAANECKDTKDPKHNE